MRRVALSLILLLSTGCALAPRGFDQGVLSRATRVERLRVTEADIADALKLRPELPFPFRLAVWFRPPRTDRPSERRLRWTDQDREVVLGVLRGLTRAGVVASVFAIPDSVLPGEDLRAVRLAAARQGGDAVLVLTGATDVDRYNHPSAVLYGTIFGLWVVPGTRADGICVAAGSLWDVRSGALYAAAEAEATSGETLPTMNLDDDSVIASAKVSALNALMQDLRVQVKKLPGAPAAQASAQ
jgi:hypothetical protein